MKLRIRKNPSFYDELDPGPHTVVYSVELSRKGGPLGLTIAGTDDRFDPIVISQLAPGGLAERYDADLKPFDVDFLFSSFFLALELFT